MGEETRDRRRILGHINAAHDHWPGSRSATFTEFLRFASLDLVLFSFPSCSSSSTMAKAKTAATKPTPSTSKAARMTASTKASAVPDTLIDSHVSNAQSELAFKALIAHAIKHSEKQAEKDLLAGGGTGGREDNVWLQVAVKTLYPEKKLKPHKMYVYFTPILRLIV